MEDVLRPISVFSTLFALYAYQDDEIILHYLVVTSALNVFVAWVRVNSFEELLAVFGTLMSFITFDVVQRSLVPARFVLTHDYATVQIYIHILMCIYMINRMFD
jgi:hypothetical protein